jgi:hypothetical protein
MIADRGCGVRTSPFFTKRYVMLLKLDNDAEISLNDFLDANTKRVDPDIEPIDDGDIKAIEVLEVGQVHQLPVHFGYCEIRRIA